MRFSPRLVVSGALCAVALAPMLAGCHVNHGVEQHFYEQHIQPIFNTSCISNTSPCHKPDAITGIAFGNLDLTSFEGVQKRRDVLRTYGNYPQPLLLLKVLPESQVVIPYGKKLFQSEIRHAGGKALSSNSDAYHELKRWLDNGANRDGILPELGPNMGRPGCNTALPPGYKAQMIPAASITAYDTFQNDIWPTLKTSCAFSTCHSSPQSDFYLTCGDSPEQQAFNFVQAAGFVVPCVRTATNTCDPDDNTVEQSEILLRPLSVRAGGINHTGGVFFQRREDLTWQAWKAWALEVREHPLLQEGKSPGREFFEANVMPKLLTRGCALEGCHSPNGFNDFRLRPGAQGFLSPGAITRNYDATLLEFMALDSVDVRQSRAVKKTLLSTGVGITHRGGGVLEDEGVKLDTPCPATFDPAATNNRALCVFKEWHRIERQDRAAAVSTMATGETLPLVFVSRPPNDDNLLQFGTYRGGADLKLAQATLGADGSVASVGAATSALATCAGLAGQDVDVRGPEWSYDGTKVVFAARAGAAGGLDLWLLDVAGMTCRRLTNDNGRAVNGVPVHNFDPVFAPDGSVVYASTRVGTLTLKTFLPNADLFRSSANLDFSNPEQMTFLLNSELAPAFMQDGRVSFTAEKATPEFYQLSGRRINWDLTDYHPLLAQRAQSTNTFTADMHPSVGYQQATEIREALDRNFLVVLSDSTAKGGGGALATFNRSIGPFEEDRTENSFLKSMIIVDPSVTARAGKTAGVYRSPFSLPNEKMLASYAANVTDPAVQTPKFDLVAVNEKTGARRPLASDPTHSYVEAALGYKRAERLLFKNLPQLVFGGHGAQSGVSADSGIMHFPDLALLATLLGANLRHGRNVEAFDKGKYLQVSIEKAPPGPGAAVMGTQQVFSDRTVVGKAPLQGDHSLMVTVPARQPLIFELLDDANNVLFTMTEEHQVTPGEYVTPGAPRPLFNAICGGCHGSISGHELDVAVTADALTGASVSASRERDPETLQ